MVQEVRGKTSNKTDAVDFFVAKLWQMSIQCCGDYWPLAYRFHAMIHIYLCSFLDLGENQIGSVLDLGQSACSLVFFCEV